MQSYRYTASARPDNKKGPKMNKLAVIITIALTVFVAGIAVYLIGYNPEWIMQGFA